MTSPDPVLEILERWDEAQAQGETVTLEQLCAGRPELLEEVRRRAEEQGRFEGWLDPERTADFTPAEEPFPRIPGYRVVRRLGRGGMGDVYEAQNLALEKARAVKVIRTAALADPRAQTRFVREMRLLARLDHDNIIPVYEATHHGAEPYFVMPLVEGGSLSEHLGRFRADPRAAAALVEKVARAVHHAHGRGVIHRDLKPSNILLGPGDKPLVGDFGIAGVLEDLAGEGSPEGAEETPVAGGELTRVTRTGQCVGTVPYMSPEQAEGDRKRIGPGTDVWALGVILYRVLTGELPFGTEPADVVLARIRTSAYRPVCEMAPGINPRLEAAVDRCLEKDPNRRFQSAAELADALHRCVDPPRTKWRAVGPLFAVLTTGVMVTLVALGYAVGLFDTAPRSTREPDTGVGASEYERITTDRIRTLEREGRVRLVGEGVGDPVFRTRNGFPKRLYPRDLDPPSGLTISCDGAGMLELLPGLPSGEWRIEAELVHRSAPTAPRNVGIFAAGRTQVTDQGRQNAMVAVLYSDYPDISALDVSSKRFSGEPHGAACGGVSVGAILASQGKRMPAAYATFLILGESRTDPRRPGEDPWPNKEPLQHPGEPGLPRALALEARPRDFRAFLGDDPDPFAEVAGFPVDAHVAYLENFLPGRFPDMRGLRWDFSPSGSVGVVLRNSELTVRRFDVLRLDR